MTRGIVKQLQDQGIGILLMDVKPVGSRKKMLKTLVTRVEEHQVHVVNVNLLILNIGGNGESTWVTPHTL